MWIEDLTEAPAFTIPWPKTGGGAKEEEYPRAWRGVISLNGERLEVRAGECVRLDRGRLTILFLRTPVCEFVATIDGQGCRSLGRLRPTCVVCEFVATIDGRGWAGIIKPNGRRVLSPGETRPAFYRGARIASYRDVTGMTGSGVPKGLAVVVGRDDYRGAVHHAAARWLGKRGAPVEPASGGD
jgi:hypothetical protein